MYPFPLLGILGNAVVVGNESAFGEERVSRFSVVTGPRSDAHITALGLIGLASGTCRLILGLNGLAGKCKGCIAVAELHEEAEPSVRLAFAGLGDVPAVIIFLGKVHGRVRGLLCTECGKDEAREAHFLGELDAARIGADCLNCVHGVCVLVVCCWYLAELRCRAALTSANCCQRQSLQVESFRVPRNTRGYDPKGSTPRGGVGELFSPLSNQTKFTKNQKKIL